jgi:hypothetical protein
MWKVEGQYTTIMQAKIEYCGEQGWGMNEAADEVINTIKAGVRDGWFFSFNRRGLDEVTFLRWVEAFRLDLLPLGILVEPGVYLRRRPTLKKGVSAVGRKKNLPAVLVPRFVVFIAGQEQSLGFLADAFYHARGARGRLFEPDATKLPPHHAEAERLLGSILGIPENVIDDYEASRRTVVNYVCSDLGGIPAEMYEEHDWAKHICWALHDDPFDLMLPSVSRTAAQQCHAVMEGFPRWDPWSTAS